MRFTREELLFMNSITTGPSPFGIVLKYPKNEDSAEIQDRILKGLKQKKVINEGNRLTQIGTLECLLWENYRKAKRHLIINQMFFAQVSNERVIGVLPATEEEYEILIIHGAVFMRLLLESGGFLCLESNKKTYQEESVPYETWQRKVGMYGDNIVVTGSFWENEIESEIVYYWKDSQGYAYDLNTEKRCQLEPVEMRKRFASLIGLKGDW